MADSSPRRIDDMGSCSATLGYSQVYLARLEQNSSWHTTCIWNDARTRTSPGNLTAEGWYQQWPRKLRKSVSGLRCWRWSAPSPAVCHSSLQHSERPLEQPTRNLNLDNPRNPPPSGLNPMKA